MNFIEVQIVFCQEIVKML